MTNSKLSEEQITAIRSVVDTHRARDRAIFSHATEKQELKGMHHTVAEMLKGPDTEEKGEEDTPHIRASVAVSWAFTASPAQSDKLHEHVDRMADNRKKREKATEEAGGPEEIRKHSLMAGELAKEFTNTLTVDPNMKSGNPCVRGMRITAFDVLELVACGKTPTEIIVEEPHLREGDIQDCIQFGLRLADTAAR